MFQRVKGERNAAKDLECVWRKQSSQSESYLILQENNRAYRSKVQTRTMGKMEQWVETLRTVDKRLERPLLFSGARLDKDKQSVVPY